MIKDIVMTDAVVDDLLDDWLERDGETFVKKRTTGRLGWEEHLEEGSSYSSYLLESPTKEDLIKRSYQLAKDMITSMNIKGKVTIKISNSSVSATDGKIVRVSTKVFDDEVLSVGDRLDVFMGLTIHEGCHLLYTNFDIPRSGDIIGFLFNVIEDERIEQLLGDEKPGFANFLEKCKYYYFGLYTKETGVPSEGLTKLQKFLNVFLGVVRYPKILTETDIVEYGKYLFEIKKVLLPFPTSSKSAHSAACRIFEIIKDFYEDEERKEYGPAGDRADDDGFDEAGGDSPGDYDDDDDDDGGEGEGEDAMDSSEGTSSDTKGSSKKTPSDEEIERRASEKLERDFRHDKASLDKLTSPKLEMSSEVERDKGLLGELCEGILEMGTDKNVLFMRATEDPIKYKESLKRVKQYIPSISRILKGNCKDYKLIHKSMRSGVLDTSKLAEAYQGVPTCYIREGEVKTDKISVVILVDESGSMAGSRIQSARDTAVLLNEALGCIPNVELFIYGHSGDIRLSRSTDIRVYRENNFQPKFSLGTITYRVENRDGVAIFEVAKRVRKQTSNPVFMFILSDGAPSAGGYTGKEAMVHTKQSVERVEKMGFNVIQICINNVYDPKEMFKHFIILEDLPRLAVDLGRVIKKIALKASKVNVS